MAKVHVLEVKVNVDLLDLFIIFYNFQIMMTTRIWLSIILVVSLACIVHGKSYICLLDVLLFIQDYPYTIYSLHDANKALCIKNLRIMPILTAISCILLNKLTNILSKSYIFYILLVFIVNCWWKMKSM